jgi:glyoxylase-like metal-dependent hydrolase (beta-lactamase superfamily II)
MAKARVRMFRQGLGDCFLLSFDAGDREKHVMIDFGVLKGTEKSTEKMTGVARAIHRLTGGRIDVLVVTHEHWDHVSGFYQARDVLQGLEVGAVWVAWTENPDHELAKELRHRKDKALKAVKTAVSALPADAAGGLGVGMNNLLNFEGGEGLAVSKTPTTAEALEWAKNRADKPRFLRPGQVLEELGIKIYVLGPPEDRKAIKKSDPSKRDSEVYELAAGAHTDAGLLAAAEALGDDGVSPEKSPQPFDSRFRVNGDGARPDYYAKENEWRRIDKDWLGAAARLALHLDSDTNNTSLVLAFELEEEGRVLLFPGDAQVGNWLSWHDVKWDGDVTTLDLLSRTVLYKVGHHASHNATLRAKGLELMTSKDLVAMIPVNRVTAKKQGWKMPFPSLNRRLRALTRGRVLDAERGVPKKQPVALDDHEWEKFSKAATVEDGQPGETGWVQYDLA